MQKIAGITVILRVCNLILLYDSHSSWCDMISHCGFIFSFILMKAVERFSTWTKAYIFSKIVLMEVWRINGVK